MITKEQIEALALGISPIDDRTCLEVEAAIDWINSNTSLKLDIQNISTFTAKSKLFIIAYIDLDMIGNGVISESIEGLSQSFSSNSKFNTLWDLAEYYLDDCLISKVRFVCSNKRYK